MITDHDYLGELNSGASCQHKIVFAGEELICGRQAMEHAVVPDVEESFPIRQAYRPNVEGLRRTSPEAETLEESAIPLPPTGAALVRAADAAQYARPAIPTEQRGQIRVRLLNATPDPLGSVAALVAQYSGRVIRDLAEVTDAERRAALEDLNKTVLNGPLEVVQFHWQIEGVTRSITHQMVRSRASFFAQESLRFAVPEGEWAEEIPLPASLTGREADKVGSWQWNARRTWQTQMGICQVHYRRLIELGMPAEEARGILPHDMPTRIHWVMDLRTLLAEAGKRTCTQAQFPWRLIFAGMASALREYRAGAREVDGLYVTEPDAWQFAAIADRLRPVCFQTGKCGFMAQFDRSCSIRTRVDAFASAGVDPQFWGTARTVDGLIEDRDGAPLQPIADWEWAADPGAARS